jgi:hypothetical protein
MMKEGIERTAEVLLSRLEQDVIMARQNIGAFDWLLTRVALGSVTIRDAELVETMMDASGSLLLGVLGRCGEMRDYARRLLLDMHAPGWTEERFSRTFEQRPPAASPRTPGSQ